MIKSVLRNNKAMVCCLSTLLLLIMWNAIDSLTDQILWYDEAGQFFISQGLNHYSSPYETRGDLLDVLYNNSHYNMDPGGFSFLLYLWTSLSCNVVFLRLLPYIFYLLSAYIVYKISAYYLVRKELPILFTALWFILPVISHQAVEVRAYTMEMLGTLGAVYFLIKKSSHLNMMNLFVFSVFLSFFCLSRYGFILVAFGVALRIIWLIVKEDSWKDMFLRILVFGTPLLLTVATVYCLSMRVQNANAQVLSYADYIGNNPIILIYPMSLTFWGIIGLGLLYKWKHRQLTELHIISIIITSVFFVFSVFNKYPWDYFRSISATMLLMLYPILWVMKRIDEGGWEKRILYLSLLSLAISIALPVLGIRIRKNPDALAIQEFCDFRRGNSSSKMTISMRYVPDLRYLFEYGMFSKMRSAWKYPELYQFIDGGEHNIGEHKTKSTIDLETTGYYLLETSEIGINNFKSFNTVSSFQHIFHKTEKD